MNSYTKSFPVLRDDDMTLFPLTIGAIEHVRRWRNASKQWFFTQDEISPADQLQWFTRYQADPTSYFWVAYLDYALVGTGALNHIDLEKCEAEWANVLVAPEAQGQGIAGRITRTIRDYGLDVLKLERIYGSLWTRNTVMLHIDVAAGYKPYRVEGDVTHVELRREDHRK